MEGTMNVIQIFDKMIKYVTSQRDITLIKVSSAETPAKKTKALAKALKNIMKHIQKIILSDQNLGNLVDDPQNQMAYNSTDKNQEIIEEFDKRFQEIAALQNELKSQQLISTKVLQQEMHQINSEAVQSLKKEIHSKHDETQKKAKNLAKEVLLQIQNSKKMQQQIEPKLQNNLMKAAHSDTIMTKIHAKPLQKCTYQELIPLKNWYSNSWRCCGKDVGCKNNVSTRDPSYVFYHCIICNFDFCEDCWNTYGQNAHNHKLTRMTLEEMILTNHAYAYGASCNGRYQNQNCNQKDQQCSPVDIVYHDFKSHDFDLCEDCAKLYKI